MKRRKQFSEGWACFCPEDEIFWTTVARTRKESLDLYLTTCGSTGDIKFWEQAYRFGIRCKPVSVMWSH